MKVHSIIQTSEIPGNRPLHELNTPCLQCVNINETKLKSEWPDKILVIYTRQINMMKL